MTALATYWLSVARGAPVEVFYVYTTTFILAASVGLFMLFLAWSPPIGKRLLMVVSDLSLGIYCVHALVLIELCKLSLFGDGLLHRPWLFIPITSVAVLILSAAVIWAMRLARPLRSVT